MRVLALVPGGIKEQLLFFPTLEDIKHAFPNAEIDVVVEPRAKSAYRVSKTVGDVIAFDYLANNSPADWANLLGVIRDREFEVAISTSGRWEAGLLLWLSGIPRRVTYSSSQLSWFYTQTVSAEVEQDSVSRYHTLLQGLNLTSDCPGAEVNVPESDIAWAEETRKQLGLDKGYVLICPTQDADVGASQAASYPITSWLTIIQDFQAKQPQLPVVLLKTAESATAVESLTQQSSGLQVITPNNLGQVAATIAGANLVLTPESYILQLSVALKVFTLALLTANRSAQSLPSVEAGQETRFVGLESPTQSLADLKPDTILQKVWGG